MYQNKGFTMIEMIFVLFIIILTSSLTLYNVKLKKVEPISIVQGRISAIIDEAKDEAIMSHQKVKLDISSKKIGYSNNHQDYYYNLPDNYYFDHIVDIYFNEYGSINKANHINLCINNKTYSIVFHLGAGDYYFK